MTTPRLDDLIEEVVALNPDGDALRHISDAVGSSDRLAELADQLVGHFVDAARASGASWTQIGAAMGVSKQAAQQRFVSNEMVPSLESLTSGRKPVGLFRRFTPRARDAVSAGVAAAKERGYPKLEAEHLLLGLTLGDEQSLAIRAMAALGAPAESVRDALASRLRPVDAASAPAGRRPFSPDAKTVLQHAVKEALAYDHNYVGTEHLLLGLLGLRRGIAADVLRELGLNHQAASAEFVRAWAVH